MKRLLLMSLAFLSVPLLKAQFPTHADTETVQDATSAELVHLTNAWTQAINAKDRTKLELLMSPDYALYGWNGELRAKRPIWLENLFQHIRIGHYEHKDIAPKVYGDLAVVTSIAYWAGTFDGKPFDETDIVVDTWRKTNGHWKVVSRTSLPEPHKNSPR